MTASAQDSADERYLTRREAETIIVQGEARSKAALDAHTREHLAEAQALQLALANLVNVRDMHEKAHVQAHVDHEKVHESEQLAVVTALASVGKERDIHANAHEREHIGHQREHELDKLAITKAEAATNLRFHAANGMREQLDTVVRTLATKEAVDAHQKRMDQRLDEQRASAHQFYEQNRLRIEQLEKGDVKDQGRSLGQGSTVGLIVGGIGLVATLLGILVVVANFASNR